MLRVVLTLTTAVVLLSQGCASSEPTATPTPTGTALATPTPTLTPPSGPTATQGGTPRPTATQPSGSTPDTSTGPIRLFDAHDHLPEGLSPDLMVSILDDVGVDKVVLMATGGGGLEDRDSRTLEAYDRYPDRVIPYLGLNGYTNITRPMREYLDSQLATGKFLGMGELLVHHYAVSGATPGGSAFEASEFSIPMDSDAVQDLMCLAAKHNVVLVVHMETNADRVAALEVALERSPTTKVIWAHQTHTKPWMGQRPSTPVRPTRPK